jgi:CheY-like chemotaxis protein
MAMILIIDDSPTELHLFQSMLEKSGFKTLVAETARPLS